MTKGPTLKHVVSGAIEDNFYTRDGIFLSSNFEYLPVFLYGCERKGFSEDTVLHGAMRYGIGWSTSDAFLMHKTDQHEPVVFHNPGRQDATHVSGELYLLPVSVIFELDARFQNGIFHRRRWVSVDYILPDEKDKKEKAVFRSEALMWCGIQEIWNEKKEKGHLKLMPVLTTKKTNRTYFEFTGIDDLPNREAIQRKVTQCL